MTYPEGLSAFPMTPANKNGDIDLGALRQLLAPLVTARVDSIGLLGSTGTYMHLDRAQKRRALTFAVENAGDVPIISGIGALRTDEAVRLAQDARAAGATAGLLAPVSYTPLTEEEVFEHFSTVAKDGGLAICVYDNPGTTHFRFTPRLLGRLSRVDGIVAVKSPAPDADQIGAHHAELAMTVTADFSLGYSGDWNSLEGLISGASTWYSVLAGLFPQTCIAAVRAIQQGDIAEARRINKALEPLWSLFKELSSLRVVYALAGILHEFQSDPPLPILPLSPENRERARTVLTQLPPDLRR